MPSVGPLTPGNLLPSISEIRQHRPRELTSEIEDPGRRVLLTLCWPSYKPTNSDTAWAMAYRKPLLESLPQVNPPGRRPSYRKAAPRCGRMDQNIWSFCPNSVDLGKPLGWSTITLIPCWNLGRTEESGPMGLASHVASIFFCWTLCDKRGGIDDVSFIRGNPRPQRMENGDAEAREIEKTVRRLSRCYSGEIGKLMFDDWSTECTDKAVGAGGKRNVGYRVMRRTCSRCLIMRLTAAIDNSGGRLCLSLALGNFTMFIPVTSLMTRGKRRWGAKRCGSMACRCLPTRQDKRPACDPLGLKGLSGNFPAWHRRGQPGGLFGFDSSQCSYRISI